MQCLKDRTASLAAYELRVLNCFGITFQFQYKHSFTIIENVNSSVKISSIISIRYKITMYWIVSESPHNYPPALIEKREQQALIPFVFESLEKSCIERPQIYSNAIDLYFLPSHRYIALNSSINLCITSSPELRVFFFCLQRNNILKSSNGIEITANNCSWQLHSQRFYYKLYIVFL